jgi:hypothetical protein
MPAPIPDPIFTAQVPTAQVPTAQVPTAQVPTAQVPTAQVPTAQVPTMPVPTVQVPTMPVPTVQVPTMPVPELIRRAVSTPAIPDMRRQLSDQAIELFTTGLDGLRLHDNVPSGFDIDEFDVHVDTFDFDLDEPPFFYADAFMRSIHTWYEEKTEEEKAWLNTNNDAPQMVLLALNGFDNLMKVHGISRQK